ncbi:MAG: hypothetical protein AAB372_03790 [Patescibacteria group bacterium]
MPLEVLHDVGRFRINTERGFRVLDILMNAFRSKAYPYGREGVEPPQLEHNLPRGGDFQLGGFEHAHFLFAACYYMRNMDSRVAFQAMTRVYSQRPDIFIPSNGQHVEPRMVTQLLLDNRLTYDMENVGRYWVENARRIVEVWDGSVLNLFQGVDTFANALSRIQNRKQGRGFLGFQEKMTSMLIYFLMHADMIPRWIFPPPIDFHINRLVFATEIVELRDTDDGTITYNRKLLAALREFFELYLKDRRACPMELADAMWLLSRTLCKKNPGNASRFIDQGNGGRDRRHEAVPISWSPSQVTRYKQSCWSCPLERECKWNIPAAGRYVQGGITLRSRRERAPLLHF